MTRTKYGGGMCGWRSGLALALCASALMAAVPAGSAQAKSDPIDARAVNASGPPAVTVVLSRIDLVSIDLHSLRIQPASRIGMATVLSLASAHRDASAVSSMSIDSVTVVRRAGAHRQRAEVVNLATPLNVSTSSALHVANYRSNIETRLHRRPVIDLSVNPSDYRAGRVIGLNAFPLYL